MTERQVSRSKLRKPLDWPRYMRSRRLSSGETAYYWEAPSWARGCIVEPAVYSEALGSDYGEAKRRCDDLLNPVFDSWRETKDLTDAQRKATFASAVDERFVPGTFNWLAREFQKTSKFSEVGATTQANYREGLGLLCGFKLRKDPRGRCFGDLPLSSISADAVDELLKALTTSRADKVRSRVVYKAMQAGRRAWFVMARKKPKFVPGANPFSKTGFKAKRVGASQEADLSELARFVNEADRQGHPSMAAAAMIAWEWMVREVDIIHRLTWGHYRAGNRPTEMQLIHNKNSDGEPLRMPLETSDGQLLFPELEARLAVLPRRGSLMIMRDTPDRLRREYLPYKLNNFQKLARKILNAAHLQHLKFESFRKGGETDCGNAGLTDQETMSLDGHKTRDMLTIYLARNVQQRVNGMLKRRALRTKSG
jgi:integrase